MAICLRQLILSSDAIEILNLKKELITKSTVRSAEEKFQSPNSKPEEDFFGDNFFWRIFGKYPIDPKIRGKFTPSGLNPKSASAIERSPNNTPTNTRV